MNKQTTTCLFSVRTLIFGIHERYYFLHECNHQCERRQRQPSGVPAAIVHDGNNGGGRQEPAEENLTGHSNL